MGGNNLIFLPNSVAQTGNPYFSNLSWEFLCIISYIVFLIIGFGFNFSILSRMFFFKEKDLNLYDLFSTNVSVTVHSLSF